MINLPSAQHHFGRLLQAFVALAVTLGLPSCDEDGWKLEGGLIGCAGSRASHTDAIIQALTAGESSSQTLVLPPGVVTEGSFIVPSLPGKNTELDATKGPDGTLTVRYRGVRDVVLNALLAGALGLDAQKFAEDAAQRAFFSDQLDKVISLVQPIIAQRMAQSQTRFETDQARPSQGLKQQFMDMLKDPAALAEIRGALLP